MQLEQILFSQGFGTRHECRGLIARGRVTVHGAVVVDPYTSAPSFGDFSITPAIEKSGSAARRATR